MVGIFLFLEIVIVVVVIVIFVILVIVDQGLRACWRVIVYGLGLTK